MMERYKYLIYKDKRAYEMHASYFKRFLASKLYY